MVSRGRGGGGGGIQRDKTRAVFEYSGRKRNQRKKMRCYLVSVFNFFALKDYLRPLTISETVSIDNLLSLIQNVGHINSNNLFGSGSGSEHGQNTGSTTDIEDDLILEKVGVLLNSVSVGEGSHAVFEHLFVDTKVSVGVGVVVPGGHALNGRESGGGLETLSRGRESRSRRGSFGIDVHDEKIRGRYGVFAKWEAGKVAKVSTVDVKTKAK